MLSQRPGPLWVRGAVASALAVVLAGCAEDPVAIDSPRLDAADAATCADLVDALPETLHDQARRLVSPATAYGAAWGDPAIVLTCGAELPAGLNEFSPCLEANGVGWFLPPEAEDDLGDSEEATDVTVASAGYRPVVTVTIPGDYRPEGVAAVTAGLAAAVEDHLELVQPCA